MILAISGPRKAGSTLLSTLTCTVTYSDDAFNISLNWQHIGKVTGTFGGRTTEPDLSNIESQNYFDLIARFTVAKSFEFFGGVQNLLDKQPPLVKSGFTLTNTVETL